MTRKSKHKLSLQNEKSFQDEIKSIFHHFLRAFIEANKAVIFRRWETDFNSTYFRAHLWENASDLTQQLSMATSVTSYKLLQKGKLCQIYTNT